MLHTTDEVVAVAFGLEADNLEIEQTAQNGFAPGQFFEHIRGWKRDVKEKSVTRFHSGFTHVARGQHQVIVVHPDEILRLGNLFNCLGVLAVHALVGIPVLGIEVAARRHVMKKRPNNFVSETGVELGNLFFGKFHGLQAIRTTARSAGEQQIGCFAAVAGPANPDARLLAPY